MKLKVPSPLEVYRSSFFALTLLFYLVPSFGFSQVPGFDLKRKLARQDLAEVEKEADFFASDKSGSAEAVFLMALLEQDAQKAMELYNQVKVSFPNSPLAADAVFQMGNYYLARGLYISARRFYLEVVENYPNSSYASDAMYFAASCMCAARQFDTCKEELRNFLRQYRQSEFGSLAQEDLRTIDPAALALEQQSKINMPDGNYTLQVGAFSQTNHALNLRNYFSKLGFPVEIREKISDGKTVYVVLVGSFKTQQDARNAGENIKKDHGKLYRVISK